MSSFYWSLTEDRKMWIFYILFLTAVTANKQPLYRKIGDKADLTPDSAETPITSIRWKQGPNIAMQWYGDEILPYRQFKDRGSLNISTGEMTITGLTLNDSGIYTAEINNKETTETELLVISPVSKPNISVSCERSMTYCVFSCDGSTTGAGPVTYRWTAGEKRRPPNKELRITKEEEEQWFICTLENPVSSISSEKVSNPFMEVNPLGSNRTSDVTSPVLWVFVVVGIIVVIVIIIYFIHKKRKDSQSRNPVWQYEGEKSGDWCDFIEPGKCSTTSDKIEEEYQKNRNGTMQLPGEEYELDFKAMTKKNPTTGKERKIRRVLLPPQSVPAVEGTSTQGTSTSPPGTSNETATSVSGLSQSGCATTIPDVREPSNQDQTSDEAHSNSNKAMVPVSPALENISNQDQTSVVPHHNSSGAGGFSTRTSSSPTIGTLPLLGSSTAQLSGFLSGLKPQWQFERRSGGWHDFQRTRVPMNECSLTNDDIQKRYLENPQGKMKFKVKEDDCELDFKEMIQTNLNTNTKRKIRVVLVPTQSLLRTFSTAFHRRARSSTSDVGTEQEMAPMLTPVQESPDPTSVVVHSNTAVMSTVSEVHETSAQDLETDAPPGTSNETVTL